MDGCDYTPPFFQHEILKGTKRKAGRMALEWGAARVQIVALSDEITREILNGKPRRRIYNELVAAGKITMSEPTFYRHLKRLAEGALGPSVSAKAATQPTERGHEQKAVPTQPLPEKPKKIAPNIAGLQEFRKPSSEDVWGEVGEGEKA